MRLLVFTMVPAFTVGSAASALATVAPQDKPDSLWVSAQARTP